MCIRDSRVTAGKAIDAAYRDVEQAFDAFLAAIPKDKPIILAGHSQGALHLTTLLKNRIAGTPLAKRIVAAYVIGWPISRDTDMAALGLPACDTPDQKGCILSWASFAEPADTSMVTGAYDGTIGFDGRPRAGTRMLCTNPLTGTPDAAAGPEANIGTLKPSDGFRKGDLITGKVGAKCDAARGFLLIGDADAAQHFVVAGYVLPGNNYHVYDITLFWANVRADALRRLATYEGKPLSLIHISFQHIARGGRMATVRGEKILHTDRNARQRLQRSGRAVGIRHFGGLDRAVGRFHDERVERLGRGDVRVECLGHFDGREITRAVAVANFCNGEIRKISHFPNPLVLSLSKHRSSFFER